MRVNLAADNFRYARVKEPDTAELALLPLGQLVNAINQREDCWILGAKQVRCDGRRTSRDGFHGGAPSSTTVEHVQVRAVAHSPDQRLYVGRGSAPTQRAGTEAHPLGAGNPPIAGHRYTSSFTLSRTATSGMTTRALRSRRSLANRSRRTARRRRSTRRAQAA